MTQITQRGSNSDQLAVRPRSDHDGQRARTKRKWRRKQPYTSYLEGLDLSSSCRVWSAIAVETHGQVACAHELVQEAERVVKAGERRCPLAVGVRGETNQGLPMPCPVNKTKGQGSRKKKGVWSYLLTFATPCRLGPIQIENNERPGNVYGT